MSAVPLAGLLGGAGPWAAFLALCLLVVWLVFTGRLVPRRVHEQAVAAERQRGDDWRDAYRAESARADIVAAQMGEIVSFVHHAPREAA